MNDPPEQPPLFPAEAEDYSRQVSERLRVGAGDADRVPDIPYSSEPHQRLDVYRPKALDDAALPVVVLAHGGAWTNGYKEWMGIFAPALTRTPAVVVTISYRLAPQHRYPDPFFDCVAALGWVHRNIRKYGGDPGRIFVGGHSSGGTLYSLVATSPGVIASAGLPSDVIKGCMPLSARFDLALDDPAPGSTEERHRGLIFAEDEAREQYSPLHLVARATCPFLIAHGSDDIPALRDQAVVMRDRLRSEGFAVEHLVLDGYDHFAAAIDIGPDGRENPWAAAVRHWLTDGPPENPTQGARW